MKAFRFRLERVLALRRREAELARRLLATAMAQEEAALAALAAARSRRSDRLHLLAAKEQAGLLVAALADQRRYLEVLRSDELQAEAALAAVRALVDQCREDLLSKRQAATVLEQLRQHQLTEHQAEQAATLGRELDDLAAARRSRAARSDAAGQKEAAS